MKIRSLKVRVAAYLLVPMAALAITLAIGGTWFVDTFVTKAFDRVLAGSIMSIAERLTVQEGQVTVDVPAAAFGMLSNSERDSIFYSVTAEGHFVTGYQALPLPDKAPPPDVLTYRDAVFLGQRVRVAMLLKPIYVSRRTALVQVAETTQGRDLLAQRMLWALTLLGATLAGIGSLLVWFAVRNGMKPLDDLRQEVERRRQRRSGPVPAFSVETVPQEALPLVGALNDLLSQLNHAMTVLRRFTADASHQLRTPVAILKTHLDLLDRQPTGSDAWHSSRRDIDSAVDRLDRLIAQLLTLASLEEDAARRSDPIPIDLADLAREAALDFTVIARRNGINLSFDASCEPVTVWADPLMLEEVVRNLVDNAVRYNRAGGRVCVRVACDSEAVARLDVEDDGPGIPIGQRDLVFERFHRVERKNAPTGSGLGLAIVRTFIDRIGGAVLLSEGWDGRGLRATITLPTVATEPGSDAQEAARPTLPSRTVVAQGCEHAVLMRTVLGPAVSGGTAPGCGSTGPSHDIA